jgi:predicted restriction endonuclease
MTGCGVVPILEACHIMPYKGRHTNHPQNGLLLRSDLHTLFDQGLIGVNPESMKVVISQNLVGSEYEPLHGRFLRLPSTTKDRPSKEAFVQHYLEMSNVKTDS